MLTPEQKKELVLYLDTRRKYIRNCASSVEGFFDDEERKACNSVPLNGKIPPEISKRLDDIYINTITFRYCFLVAVCSLVEESLKQICELIIPNYSQELKKFRGSKFHKHIEALKSAGKNLAPIQEQISLFDDTITVRNAIVHSWGKIDKDKKRAELETIIEKYGKKDGTNSWIEKTKDGEILLNDNSIIVTATHIVRHILKSAKFI